MTQNRQPLSPQRRAQGRKSRDPKSGSRRGSCGQRARAPLTGFRASPPRQATADIQSFARLAGIEAVVRGIALSAYPLVMYRAWDSAATVAQLYFLVGVISLLTSLSLPMVARHIPRRMIYGFGAALYICSASIAMLGGKAVTLALLCHTMATSMVFVCFNAYVLDHVDKSRFGRLESLRLLYGGLGWTVGPVLGVWLLQFWAGAPFVIVGIAAVVLLMTFWRLRLGDGRVIALTRKNTASPLPYLRRFAAQPRLVAGWLFTVIRSCGWWVYHVYIGIFAVQNGLGEQTGGIATSLANMGLFLAPLMLRWMQQHSVRAAVRTGFFAASLCFVLASVFSPWPWSTVALLVLGSYFLVLLDICGGLPFMMAVKPSQRTEMSAVYSSFRDVSSILTPALVWVVLQFSPLAGVFAAVGVALMGAWAMAGRLHPRLGVPATRRVRSPGRPSHEAH